MPAVSGALAAFNATLWYSSSKIDHTEAAIETLVGTASNQIINVEDMPSVAKERTIIPLPNYGNERSGALPGPIDSTTFEFTLTLDMSNANHVAIRDDDGTTERTLVIRYRQSDSNITYVAFDGYFANASVNQTYDGAVLLEASFAINSAVDWVDNS